MGQGMFKLTKGGEEAQKGKQALIKYIQEQFETNFKDADDFHVFYRKLYDTINKFADEKGEMVIIMPSEEKLKKAFDQEHKGFKRPITREEFQNIIKAMVSFDNVHMGQKAIETLLFMFGVPICALLAKRAIPRTASISDDVVIPFATSGTVIVLAATQRL